MSRTLPQGSNEREWTFLSGLQEEKRLLSKVPGSKANFQGSKVPRPPSLSTLLIKWCDPSQFYLWPHNFSFLATKEFHSGMNVNLQCTRRLISLDRFSAEFDRVLIPSLVPSRSLSLSSEREVHVRTWERVIRWRHEISRQIPNRVSGKGMPGY